MSKMQDSQKIITLSIIVILVISFSVSIVMTISAVNEESKDYITVGTCTPFPPFEENVNGKIIGFDIDIATEIARAMNKQLKIKDYMDFDALLPALRSGDIDMVIAGMTISTDRGEVVNFSISYYNSSQSFLVMKGVTVDYTNIGCQEETTSHYFIQDNYPNATITTFDSLTVGLQYLKFNEVSTILLDTPVALRFAHTHNDIEISITIDTGETYGVAVQKNDPDNMLPIINQVINDLDYDSFMTKWFR